jgi:hypothetical protein
MLSKEAHGQNERSEKAEQNRFLFRELQFEKNFMNPSEYHHQRLLRRTLQLQQFC